MHRAVQQGVDKINSLQADMLLAEEIDIELNKSMSRFVNLKYGKNNKFNAGFEESQKRIDDLRSLIREQNLAVTFKEQLNAKTWVEFPANYMYYLNSQSMILINECNPITFNVSGAANINYFTFDLNFITQNNTGFIDSIWMRTDPNDVTTANYLNIPVFNLPSQFTFPQDIQALRLWIIDPANWPVGFQIYWETFGTINHTNQFIVVVDVDLYPQFNWDASVTNTYTSTNLVTQLVSLNSFNVMIDQTDAQFAQLSAVGSRVTTDPTTILRVQNKFVQLDDIYTLLNDPFNTTKHTNPLFTVRQNNMDIYTNDIFIIYVLKLTYLKTK